MVTRRWLLRHPAWPARERQRGLDLWRVAASRKPIVGELVWSARAVRTLVRLRPDVIQAHDLSSPASIALVAGGLVGAPVVTKILSTGPEADIDRLLAKPLGRYRLAAAARRVSAFIAVSREVEQELADNGVSAAKIRRVPNGVDAEHFRPARPTERGAGRDALGLPREELVGLYVGRLDAGKRLDVLLDAWGAVRGHLLIVGGTEKQRHQRGLSELASNLGPGRVTFIPDADDPAPLYRVADVYVSASGTEGMSASVLEAMASGLPVVATPAGGMNELLGGGAGVVARDESASALAEGVNELAADADRRERSGRVGRDRVVANYSLEETAERLVALYRELLAAR